MTLDLKTADQLLQAVKTKPSLPNPTDEYHPTDENLWKIVLEVASGDRLKYERSGREINAPNGPQGFRNMPHNPNGIAWAVKQYNGFGGHWKSASQDKIPGGLADKGPPKDLDPKQLEMGLKVEMEHTGDKNVAREIALDHLTEDPQYYSKLKVMESKKGWDERLRRMAAGGVDVTSGPDTAEAQKLASEGLLRLAGCVGERHYWDITRVGLRHVQAGLKMDILQRVAELAALRKAYKEGEYVSEPDKAKIADFAKWFRQHFRVDSSKTPKGMKSVKETANAFLKSLEVYGTPYGKLSPGALDLTNHSTWSWLEGRLDDLVLHFTAEGDTSRGKTEAVVVEINGRHATYFNRGNVSEANFRQYAERLDVIFDKLKGFHKKALTGSLKVVFVGSQQMKVQGKYRTAVDEMWIKATPQVMKRSGASYGSPEYIIVHELGHRFERFNRLADNFDSERWRTTRYSLKDGEAFAELFALSHFNLTGSWDQATVEKFERIMTGQEKAATVAPPRPNDDSRVPTQWAK